MCIADKPGFCLLCMHHVPIPGTSRDITFEGPGADIGKTQSFRFDSTQSQEVMILLNSWLTMAFQEFIQINSQLDMTFLNLTQIDSRLKRIPRYSFRSTHGSSGFPGNQIKLLMTQDASPRFDSNPLMTQSKNIWFRVDSLFDSESYLCLARCRISFEIGLVWFFVPFSFFSIVHLFSKRDKSLHRTRIIYDLVLGLW